MAAPNGGLRGHNQGPNYDDDDNHSVDGDSDEGADNDVEARRKGDSFTFVIKTDVDLMMLLLTALAFASRLWMLEQPRAIVFDELHYGRFASMYMKRTFFFDVHPPLGKLLIALTGFVSGYDGTFNFDKIGREYTSDVPVWYLRLFPAICGSLLVPAVYYLTLTLTVSRWCAALAGSLILLDNALLTQSRYMLMEGPLLLFICLSFWSCLKFCECNRSDRYSVVWWAWLFTLSLSTIAAISIKYSAIYSSILVLFIVGRDFWRMLPKQDLSDWQLIKHLTYMVCVLVVLPIIVYLGIFYVHFSILTKAGPHDDVMSSAFQTSLEGGLAAITKGQPLEIAYGSQITLRHNSGKPCWLHSHQQVYPIRYADGRGSSHQQQVTCYNFKDVNNWWIVKDPKRNVLVVDEPIRPVKDGDIVQLIHGMTSRALNSHDVAAPVSPQHQEVTCYIDYNISSSAQNLWRVDILNKETEGPVWHTIKSQVQLVHINTSQALRLSGKQLPEWGFHQFEVVTDKILSQDWTVWNVEEHRYTRSKDDDEIEQELSEAEMIPLNPTEIGFFGKFTELQWKMLTTQRDVQLEHKFSSEPLEWPLSERNIAYWVNPETNAQIHLIGNPLLWLSATLAIAVYTSLLVIYLLRRRRRCFDITEDEWEKFKLGGEVLLAGYLLNYVPYFFTDRTLFLHHYIPALLFKVVMIAYVVGHIHSILRSSAVRSVYTMLVIVWFTAVVNMFRTLSVISYGNNAMDQSDIDNLKWKDSWDFIILK